MSEALQSSVPETSGGEEASGGMLPVRESPPKKIEKTYKKINTRKPRLATRAYNCRGHAKKSQGRGVVDRGLQAEKA